MSENPARGTRPCQGGSTVDRDDGCDDAPGSSIAYSSADRSCGRGGETLVKLVMFK